MSIKRKVKAVDKLYQELDQEMQLFRQGTGLYCVSGCAKCCFKSDIEATILEFIPFAYQLFINNEAESWHEKLSTLQNSQVCSVLQVLNTDGRQGKCSAYAYRGMICRLFGYSAAFDKYGEKRLSTCNVIKTELVEEYNKATQWLKEGKTTPVMRNYYFRLRNIDSKLTDTFYPINQAIRLAIEEVLVYYSYRRAPKAS